MTRSVIAIACALSFVTGCARPPAAPAPQIGGPSGVITWLATSGLDKPVPGVDQGTVVHEGTLFVLWSDFDGGSASSSSSNSQGLTCRGQVRTRDGLKVEFSFETKDGQSGPVTIDRENHDLKDGHLFLVTRDRERVRVSQLKRDLGDLQFTRENLEAFGRKDAELIAFFGKSTKPE